MMVVLLGAGVGLLLAGLAALAYGILIKDFSFGNALIISGAVTACSGLIIFALGVVGRELQSIARRLGGEFPVAPLGHPLEASVAPPAPRAEPGNLIPGREAPPMEMPAAGPVPPPWPMEATPDAPPPPAEGAPQLRQRRNLLFTSTSRKDRERAASRAGEPLAPDLLSPDLRPPPSAAPPAIEPAVPPAPPTFEDAWPKPERAARPGEAPPPRRTRMPPPAAAEGSVPPPAPREPTPQVTVLKSGVVDGMAYSLYSDGSIEAQMPEGMMRFASIDELRAHLDQRP
ncbi:DUF308 domain-containing protein [Bradyrhizobium lablabi]|uniref:DUF308 domain-containing protein n=1 Tax=Bradyrhizobium lablabi TaxID=722472 RepID=UPI001BAC57AB|nr:DUF308 domain-containing protein [Bradyrhizobium lablabi]MBR1122047.1 DUF308 domain-containing protein [Bradyrhizobium lablabi]